MALPASGQTISLSQVNTELGRPATQAISMNESAVRTLFGVASGPISHSNGHGKADAVTINLTIAANTLNYNIKSAMIASGWDQVKKAIVNLTINTGVYVGSAGAGSWSMDTGATFPVGSTINIINNGYIMGAGGAGGTGGGYNSSGYAGGNGGPALRVQHPVNITNASGYIYGGGGGGGGSEGGHTSGYGSGGGGGGGQGYNGGGGGGAVGGNPTGQGGGAGSATGPGGGGAGGYAYQVRGGTGGTAGNAGSLASRQWYSSGTPGAAGNAITGVSNVTWVSGNTRVYGPQV